MSSEWQYSLADDTSNNWALSGESEGTDEVLASQSYQGIPVLLHFIRNNPARRRIVSPINGRGSWF